MSTTIQCCLMFTMSTIEYRKTLTALIRRVDTHCCGNLKLYRVCPSNIVQHWPGWLVALLWELWSCATLIITVANIRYGQSAHLTSDTQWLHGALHWCRCWSSPRPSTSSACTVNTSSHVLHGTAEYYRVQHYILCTIPHANDTLRCGLWASIAPNWIADRTCQRANLFFPFQAISKCQSFKRSEGKIKNPNFSGSSTFLVPRRGGYLKCW